MYGLLPTLYHISVVEVKYSTACSCVATFSLVLEYKAGIVVLEKYVELWISYLLSNFLIMSLKPLFVTVCIGKLSLAIK